MLSFVDSKSKFQAFEIFQSEADGDLGLLIHLAPKHVVSGLNVGIDYATTLNRMVEAMHALVIMSKVLIVIWNHVNVRKHFL